MNSKTRSQYPLPLILVVLVLAFNFVSSNPAEAADLHGPRVILLQDGVAKSVAPLGEVAARAPVAALPDAFPGLDRRTYDNQDTDHSNGYSNGSAGLGSLLDDFVVPAGGTQIMRFDWLVSWATAVSGLGTGVQISIRNNDPNGGGPGVDGPGTLRTTAVVTGYGEARTGRSGFTLPEVWSWATMEKISLPPGRYWIEWTVVGPENNFVWVKAAMRDNECWLDWASAGGLQPCSSQFGGVMVDLAWTLSSHHQYSLAYASLGGASNGNDDGGAVVIIDPNTGAGRYLGTPMPGRGLPGIAANSSNQLFAVTDDLRATVNAKLIEVDPRNGSLINTVGDLMVGATPETLHDLAIQPGTDMLFGTATGGQGLAANTLVTVNTNNASVTQVGLDPTVALANGFLAIAFAPNGTLWGIYTGAGEIFALDPSTGDLLNTLPIGPAGVGAVSLGVRPMNGQLFFAECCNITTANDIWALNMATGVATNLGSVGGDRRVHDITFLFWIFVDPFETDSLGAWSLAIP